MKCRYLLLLITAFFLASTLFAADDEISRVSEKYGFLGPEIVKIGENMQYLQIADFDGDGNVDFMVVNSAEKKVFTFYHSDEPTLKFRVESFVIEKAVACPTVGDMDGDGRVDLTFLDDKNKVNIRFHEKDKRMFAPPQELESEVKKGALLYAIDLNNDDKTEIIILDEESINIISYDKDRTFQKPKKYENTLKKVVNFGLADIDGNGRKDIILIDQTSQIIAFRLQSADGNFGPTITQKVEGFEVGKFADVDGDKCDEMSGLQSQTNALKIYNYCLPEELKTDRKKIFKLSQMRDHQFKNSNSYKDLTIGDVNDDKMIDVVYIDNTQAEINLYLQGKSGELNEKQTFPSFVGARAIAIGDINGDQKNEVVILSPQEKAIGIIHMTAEGRLSFPKPIQTEEVPLTFTLADLNQDQKLELIYGARSEKSDKGFIFIMSQDVKGTLNTTQKIELTSKQGTIIEKIKVVDINNDKLPDLIVFFEIGAPVIFLQQKDGKFQDVTTNDPIVAGILNKTGQAQFTWGDVNQDNSKELFISRNNFARSLIWKTEGKPELLDQYNGKSPESSIQTALTIDLDRDTIPEIVLYDSQLKLLTILKKSAQQLYEIVENIDVGYFTIKEIFAEDLNNDGIKDMLLFGQERFGIIYSGKTDPQFELRSEYTTSIKRGVYTKYAIGDVNGDGKKDVVIIEAKRHNMEILSLDEKGNLKQELTFQIFEDPQTDLLDEEKDDYHWKQLPTNEPREIKIIDINGDKKEDILLIAHRNLLIYLQE